MTEGKKLGKQMQASDKISTADSYFLAFSNTFARPSIASKCFLPFYSADATTW